MFPHVTFTSSDISSLNRYCSSQENLTIDHVLPAARGGDWKWENLVRQSIGNIFN